MLYQLFAFMTVYSLCERKIKDVLEYAVIALSSILAVTAISMTFFREEKAVMLWGLMSNIITIGEKRVRGVVCYACWASDKLWSCKNVNCAS